jgi:hypothetical protein
MSSSGTTRGMSVTEQSRSYAPPPGAGNSSRRVGGSWVVSGVQSIKPGAEGASRSIVDTSSRESEVVQYDPERESLLARQRAFSASYVTESSAGSAAAPVPARSVSSGVVLNHGPFGSFKLMRNEANSPYLYAPSPEEVSPLEHGRSYQ